MVNTNKLPSESRDVQDLNSYCVTPHMKLQSTSEYRTSKWKTFKPNIQILEKFEKQFLEFGFQLISPFENQSGFQSANLP
jgi:hypothetical protein